MANTGAYLLPGERRGGLVLVYDGYRYQRNKISAGTKVYWRCTDKKCRVPLHTNDFGSGENIVVLDNQQPEHAHPPEHGRLDRFQFIREIKNVIRREPSLPVRRAYDEVTSRLPHAQRINFPDFDGVRTSLLRFRARSCRPVASQSVDMADIHGAWAETLGGQRELLAIDNAIGVAVFASRRELEVLEQCSEIFIDGTFHTAPAPFTQIVTAYGRYRGLILPLSISLVTNKREEQYLYVLQAIKREIIAITDRPLSPSLVITDFEVDLINAIGKELPHADSRVCKSPWRKLTELGLEGPYLRDPALQRVVGRMLGFGYQLPIPHVALSFETCTDETRVQEVVQQYPQLQQYFEYVEQTYIGGPVFHVPFTTYMLNQNQQPCTGLLQHMEQTVNGSPSQSCQVERHDPQDPQNPQRRSSDRRGRRRNLEGRVKRLHRACQRLPLDSPKVQDHGQAR
ncbi:uncharacterized protein LOC119725901 [Patiria miniata]|uniref:FLYWCH-type domain-containing protein n=1 Tax=Patiria miniata TaxID=46514 RepID=A0A913ZNQ7_PATMI|nr:uncharacterized protein LOC119725901 [Patiria miniata]